MELAFLNLALILLIGMPGFNGMPLYDCAQFFMPGVDSTKWPRVRSFEDLLTRPLILWTIAATLNWVKQPYRLQVFHLTNGLLHWLNSILIYKVAVALGMDSGAAMVASLVFAVHPLAWSAVAPVVAPRSQVVGATFLFLAVWATVSGWPLLAIPLMALGFTAKEDTVAGIPLVVALSFIYSAPQRWQLVGFLAIFGYLFRVELWRQFLRKVRNNGDKPLREMGIAASLPQPQASLTAFMENLWRFPLWMIGLKQNVDPDPKPVSWHSWRFWTVSGILLILVLLLAYFSQIATIAALLMIGSSPWTLTWLLPMPDTISESRAYSAVGGAALLFSPLVATVPLVSVLVISYLSIRAALRSYKQRDGLAYWMSAYTGGSHKLRVLINIGAAYQNIGDAQKAKEWHDMALAQDPTSGLAMANLALWYEGLCRIERMQLGQQFVQYGVLDQAVAEAAVARSRAALKESLRLMTEAERLCPDPEGVRYYANLVREHAAKAGIA